MIPNRCIEIQTSPLDRPSVPDWFAEVVMMARHLEAKGLLEAFAQQVRLVRGRFGSGSAHRLSRAVDGVCHQRGTDAGRLL